jgi:hypothetical protein
VCARGEERATFYRRPMRADGVCVVPRCKGGGIKAWRAAAEVHNTSPAGGTVEGPVGALAGAGASPYGSGCGEPNDGVGLGRAAVRRAGGGRRRATWRHTMAHRAGARERALAGISKSPCLDAKFFIISK